MCPEWTQDPLVFASGIAPQIRNMSLLVAIRSGEVFPPMLARAVASLDHMLEGRLTLNVISSDLPGTRLDTESRYRRSGEAIEILQQVWSQDHVHFDGEFWQLRIDTTDPARTWQQNGGPLLYFGGYSELACARRIVTCTSCGPIPRRDCSPRCVTSARELRSTGARSTSDFGSTVSQQSRKEKPNVERVTLSPDGPEVSRIPWGAWRIVDDPTPSAAERTRTVRQIIDTCLETGITTVDHADIYGGYRCEALFGEVRGTHPSFVTDWRSSRSAESV